MSRWTNQLPRAEGSASDEAASSAEGSASDEAESSEERSDEEDN
jgi:hypothetical protein